MNFFTKLRCSLGMHQGTWKTIDEFGCLQSRFCLSCGEPQYRERHNWSGPDYPLGYIPDVEDVMRAECYRLLAKSMVQRYALNSKCRANQVNIIVGICIDVGRFVGSIEE